MRHAVLAGLGAILALSGAMPVQAAGNPTANVLAVDCDRACLTAALESVLSAIAAKDISKLPLANDVKSTQNGVEVRLDDGLWQTVDAVGPYRMFAIDPVSGQAGVYTVMTQGPKKLLVALRIAVWEQKIHEIEILSAAGNGNPGPMQDPGGFVEKLGKPHPNFLRTVPPADRPSRRDLIRVANSYFSNLQGSTGKTTAPFAPTCNRIENGVQTTNVKGPGRGSGPNILAMGCEEQQKTGFFRFVTSIRDRRFPIVDEERGLVMAFGYFDHSGTIRDVTLADGQKATASFRNPLTFVISETFQIELGPQGTGRIDQVEAVLESVPYKMRNAVWTEGDHIP